MHSGTAIAIRDVPATASHGTAGVLGGCQGSGCFGRRAVEDPLSSGWAGEAVRPPCCVVCGLWRSARGPSVPGRPFPMTTTTTRASANANAETPPALPFRVGHGFDLHRLESVDEFPDLKLIIGGIEIPHDRGCVAHSDGDVLMHCVVDAITGALGLPDIGQLFPDTDPKWKGQTSDAFVREAVRLMELEGYAIGNLDCTLIAQRPKISPHKDSIRANVAKVLGVHESVVNVKAKTHEKVDSLGENRSIACHTVIMLIRA